MNKSMTVINFAKQTDTGEALMDMWVDFWNQDQTINHKKTGLDFSTVDKKGNPITFAEKRELLDNAMKEEIFKRAGITNPQMYPVEVWSTNQQLSWHTFAVVNMLIDAVLPDTILKSIGDYTDVRVVGWGDNASFEVESRDLFYIAKMARGIREGEVKKAYKGMVTITPEQRGVSVGVGLYRVLAGKESLASFTVRAARSMETEVALDAYAAFYAAMNALPTSAPALRHVGYTQADLLSIGQIVTAANGGRQAMIVGTKAALGQVLPADVNYRYQLDSEFVKIGYIKEFLGMSIMEMPQVLNWKTYALALSDSRLWIISPGAEKPVKLVLEGSTLANMGGTWDNATLTQNATLIKSWGTGIATTALAGQIEL
jgi:hypothetical protein